MTYQDGTHDPVSAAELAHDRAESKRPWHVCTRCEDECWNEDASAENWLVCALADCDVELCEECVIFIFETSDDLVNDDRYLSVESVHNAGFCSPACMARELEAHGWEYRKGRLLKHCDEAQIDVDEAKARELAYPSDTYGAFACLSIGLVTLISRVRAVCNLERK